MVPCSFGFGYTHGGTQHCEGETEDEFAQRIWQEMQRLRQAVSGPTAATQEAWGAADKAAKQRDVRAPPLSWLQLCQAVRHVSLMHLSAHALCASEGMPCL